MAFTSSKDEAGTATGHPLGALPREDLDLITELVLQSGSIKGLAQAYGVSYPTMRSRLDRVIERLDGAVNGRTPDPLTDLLADLVEKGAITPSHARAIRDVAQRTQENQA